MATESDLRDILLNARLVDLLRRKTEAELLGYGTKTYEALIEIYHMEIAEIEDTRSKQPNAPRTQAA